MAEGARIRKIVISRFRGIEGLSWRPAEGMNVILGGGDVGKTTILEAINLLLSPTNSPVISEVDYWRRNPAEEFMIEAVLALQAETAINNQTSQNWPWHWDGENAVLPPVVEDGDDLLAPGDPVYKVRVRGTSELDLAWEVIQPNEEISHFSVAVRRKIGVVKLAAEDRNDRDLRLVYGSALDRLFSDTTLRARIAQEVSRLDLRAAVGEESLEKLGKLNTSVVEAALPGGLNLGLTTTQGLSIGALIGLLADKAGIELPLSTWGAGTRRMTALEIASFSRAQGGIVTIDELERGLEPYRLHKLIQNTIAGGGQSFVTTHSPVAITSAENAALWYLDTDGNLGALPNDKISAQQKRDPETFLAKVAVIGEGPTEVGFLSYLLEKAFGANPLDYGVRVCDGQGNNAVLGLLETLAATGLRFSALADDEGTAGGRWAAVKARLRERLLQWPAACTEQVVIEAIGDDKLPDLIRDEDGDLRGDRMRTLAARLDIADKSFEEVERAANDKGHSLKALVIAAASGNTDDVDPGDPSTRKEWKKHGRQWFKSENGGRELAEKMVALGAWPEIQPQILPLVNAILEAAGRAPIEALDL